MSSMCGFAVDGFSFGDGGGFYGGLSDITWIAGFCFASIYICHLLELIYVLLSSEFALYMSVLAMHMIGAIS